MLEIARMWAVDGESTTVGVDARQRKWLKSNRAFKSCYEREFMRNKL